VADAETIMVPMTVKLAGDYKELYQYGVDAALSIAPSPISLRKSMANAEKLIADAAERALRLILIRLEK